MSHWEKVHGVGVMSAVAAVIEDASGRVLLCRLNGGHRLWSLPGGRIRNAESPTHAAVRDIREETGMETEMINLIGMYQLTGDACGDDVPDLLVYVFRARLRIGEPALNAPGRISRLSWHDPKDLPEPLTATTRTAIEDAVAGECGLLRKVQRDAEPVIPDAVDTDPNAVIPSQSAAAAYAT